MVDYTTKTEFEAEDILIEGVDLLSPTVLNWPHNVLANNLDVIKSQLDYLATALGESYQTGRTDGSDPSFADIRTGMGPFFVKNGMTYKEALIALDKAVDMLRAFVTSRTKRAPAKVPIITDQEIIIPEIKPAYQNWYIVPDSTKTTQTLFPANYYPGIWNVPANTGAFFAAQSPRIYLAGQDPTGQPLIYGLFSRYPVYFGVGSVSGNQYIIYDYMTSNSGMTFQHGHGGGVSGTCLTYVDVYYSNQEGIFRTGSTSAWPVLSSSPAVFYHYPINVLSNNSTAYRDPHSSLNRVSWSAGDGHYTPGVGYTVDVFVGNFDSSTSPPSFTSHEYSFGLDNAGANFRRSLCAAPSYTHDDYSLATWVYNNYLYVWYPDKHVDEWEGQINPYTYTRPAGVIPNPDPYDLSDGNKWANLTCPNILQTSYPIDGARRILVVWSGRSNVNQKYSIYMCYSDDEGTTWSEAQTILTSDSYHYLCPHLVQLSNTGLVLTFTTDEGQSSTSTGDYCRNVKCCISYDGGLTWTNKVTLMVFPENKACYINPTWKTTNTTPVYAPAAKLLELQTGNLVLFGEDAVYMYRQKVLLKI